MEIMVYFSGSSANSKELIVTILHKKYDPIEEVIYWIDPTTSQLFKHSLLNDDLTNSCPKEL